MRVLAEVCAVPVFLLFCNVGKSVTANVQGLNQNGAPLGPTACKLSPASVRRSEVGDHRPVTRGEQAASSTTATSHKSEWLGQRGRSTGGHCFYGTDIGRSVGHSGSAVRPSARPLGKITLRVCIVTRRAAYAARLYGVVTTADVRQSLGVTLNVIYPPYTPLDQFSHFRTTAVPAMRGGGDGHPCAIWNAL